MYYYSFSSNYHWHLMILNKLSPMKHLTSNDRRAPLRNRGTSQVSVKKVIIYTMNENYIPGKLSIDSPWAMAVVGKMWLPLYLNICAIVFLFDSVWFEVVCGNDDNWVDMEVNFETSIKLRLLRQMQLILWRNGMETIFASLIRREISLANDQQYGELCFLCGRSEQFVDF